VANEIQSPTRVLVVDDHPIVRLGIRQMIDAEAGFCICGETDCPALAVQLAQSGNVDLAIVDLSLRNSTGLELIRTLHEARPELPILVLTMHDELLFAERALRAGARGYIMKRESIDRLLDAIHEVVAGRIYVSEQISQTVLAKLGRDVVQVSGVGTLTDRELTVFDQVGRGQSTSEIALRLGVSVKTIETYRSNIKAKLHLKDAADLIRFAATWTAQL
jgi:DNA-binding NarL/FixJ family response regulator